MVNYSVQSVYIGMSVARQWVDHDSPESEGRVLSWVTTVESRVESRVRKKWLESQLEFKGKSRVNGFDLQVNIFSIEQFVVNVNDRSKRK